MEEYAVSGDGVLSPAAHRAQQLSDVVRLCSSCVHVDIAGLYMCCILFQRRALEVLYDGCSGFVGACCGLSWSGFCWMGRFQWSGGAVGPFFFGLRLDMCFL